MSDGRRAQPSMDAVADAENTVRELRAVLERTGITLPSLGLDPLMLARDRPAPLVELGRCTPEMARRLVRALRKAPGGGPGKAGDGGKKVRDEVRDEENGAGA